MKKQTASEQGVAAEEHIEPSPSSQKDEDTTSERSAKLQDIKVEVDSEKDDANDLNNSQHDGSQQSAPQSSGQASDSFNQQSSAPNSSRGSTKASADEDTMSDNLDDGAELTYGYRIPDGAPMYPGDPGPGQLPNNDEKEREEDGTLILTNKWIRELFKREPRRYYRTPCLNDKLYFHYKGFGKIQNIEQFVNLKCFYFEGNGCTSLKGLETNTQLLSLFVQENVIEDMRGLETLTKLRTLNLADNCIKTICGLESLPVLDSIYLKRNRIGHSGNGSFSDIKGLLECPSLSNIDLQDNHIEDEACLEMIFEKMPNLLVLYLQNNGIAKKIQPYRKVFIDRLKKLKYLDDRPVFEEDRRRAHAYARGGIDEERKEMKLIRKEKEDAHWANHEAFNQMIQKAREEKKDKEEKKLTMKEMMAEAKKKKNDAAAESADKEEKKEPSQIEKDKADGKYRHTTEQLNEFAEADKFMKEAKEIADKRYYEKQNDIAHEVDEDAEKRQQEFDDKMARIRQAKASEYDKLAEVMLGKSGVSAEEIKQFVKEGKISKDEDPKIEEVDDDAPDLEEVNQDELEKVKQQKQREWLNDVIAKKTEEAEKKGVSASSVSPGMSGMKIEEVHSLSEPKEEKEDSESEEEQIETGKEQLPTLSEKEKAIVDMQKMQEALGYTDATEFDELD